MNNRVASLLLLIIVSLPAAAQTDTTSAKPSWFMTIDGGLLFARKTVESAPSISMRQGMRYRRFALSVGMAYDTYKYWRALPVFSGLSFDFVQGPGHALYLQMDAGYSKAWYRESREGITEVEDVGGYVYHPAIGYRGGLGRVQIHISAGYKIQNVEWNPPSWGWGGWIGQRVTAKQQLERVSFLIGIGFH